jgi:ubiquinone/menaquinone biosynthesis C-methylase UbiE
MFKVKSLSCLTFIFIFIAEGLSLSQENPYEVAAIIGIKEGMQIGEAGAGDGYYSFLFSEMAGRNGHIYVNEINRKLLRKIDERCRNKKINNMSTVRGKISDPCFPVDTLDMVFMRHVLHCMKKPARWLGNLGKYMKTGALLVIIDGDPDIVGYGHNYLIKKEEVMKMAENGGFRLFKLEKILLPEDYIYIFKKNY